MRFFFFPLNCEEYLKKKVKNRKTPEAEALSIASRPTIIIIDLLL